MAEKMVKTEQKEKPEKKEKKEKSDPASLKPLSPRGVVLTFNDQGRVVREFDKNCTIWAVMHVFLSVRLAHEATPEDMEGCGLVDFSSPRAPLPLSATIAECRLANGTRMESEDSLGN